MRSSRPVSIRLYTVGLAYLVALQTARFGAVRTKVRVLESLVADVALEEFVQALLQGEKDTTEKVLSRTHNTLSLYP